MPALRVQIPQVTGKLQLDFGKQYGKVVDLARKNVQDGKKQIMGTEKKMYKRMGAFLKRQSKLISTLMKRVTKSAKKYSKKLKKNVDKQMAVVDDMTDFSMDTEGMIENSETDLEHIQESTDAGSPGLSHVEEKIDEEYEILMGLIEEGIEGFEPIVEDTLAEFEENGAREADKYKRKFGLTLR